MGNFCERAKLQRGQLVMRHADCCWGMRWWVPSVGHLNSRRRDPHLTLATGTGSGTGRVWDGRASRQAAAAAASDGDREMSSSLLKAPKVMSMAELWRNEAEGPLRPRTRRGRRRAKWAAAESNWVWRAAPRT